MSIEALIQAHTEALLANTEAVKLLTLSLAGRSASSATKAADAVEKPKADPKPEIKVEEKKPVGDGVTDDTAALQALVDKTKTEKCSAVPYETVRALVLKLAPTQRDAIKALNVKHGIANLKVLLDKEDDFSTVNDQAKLEAVYADLQELEA